VFEANLAALSRTNPQLVERLRDVPSDPGAAFSLADDGALTGVKDGRAMASRRRPLDEAASLAHTVDVREAGGLCVLGFGLGHHVRAVGEKLRHSGVLIVFEPDLGLLRAVLERVDHSAWITGTNVVIVSDESDTASLTTSISGVEALLALGVEIIEHPPSKARLGSRAAVFGETLSRVVRGVRTQIATTLVQSEVTLTNLLGNIEDYAIREGVAALAGVQRGRPAIVVSAGPSLARNIDMLALPGVRDRFVIIATQTVLKPLLARGIRPHFVTALDYHEISARFYEGLTPRDVEGVTLVVEPKASPAIPRAFPGRVRMAQDQWLDEVLGTELARPLGRIAPGATVAHLAYYLARHMGCDPVVLVGQDLGFTDGQYYAAGAAIHDVWSGELGPFQTLETLEWQRIARMRHTLIRATDVLGRPIYTDEQMSSYLLQFERDFADDERRGLRVIDATEGGVHKRHTTTQNLADVIVELAGEPVAPEPGPGASPPKAGTGRVRERLGELRRNTSRLVAACERSVELLREMSSGTLDRRELNDRIALLHRERDRAESLGDAYTLMHHLAQAEALNRFQADRRAALESALTPEQRQLRDIERDLRNVEGLTRSARTLLTLLDATIARTNDKPDEHAGLTIGRRHTAEQEQSRVHATSPDRPRVVAIIRVDPDRSSLGAPRDLSAEVFDGKNALELTLARLSRCALLDGVVLLCDDPEHVRGLVRTSPSTLDVRFERTKDDRTYRDAVARARRFMAHAWRGGVGQLSVYDELGEPGAFAHATRSAGARAALLVGDDWSCVDPALCDRVIERFLSDDRSRFVFTQAAPGLCGAVASPDTLAELASQRPRAGVFSTLGGLLGYIPVAPIADPIARDACVRVDPILRDAHARVMCDTSEHARSIRSVLETEGIDADTATLLHALDPLMLGSTPSGPGHLTLEVCAGRLTSGLRLGWLTGTAREPVERPRMSLRVATRIFAQLGTLRSDACVTLAGAGDPLLHPELHEIIAAARESGVLGVHVRTDLVRDDLVHDHGALERLLALDADVISVDVAADNAHIYRQLMGIDTFDRVRSGVESLASVLRERDASGFGPPWIVPRLTRCDETYEQIEGAYARWLMVCGSCVIDSMHAPGALARTEERNRRITPLPLPRRASRRARRQEMLILSDGLAPVHAWDLRGEMVVGDASREPLGDLWRRVVTRRSGGRIAIPSRSAA
jgi:hypothetical protein